MEEHSKTNSLPVADYKLAAALVGFSVFLDRFVYFGSLTLLYAFLRDTLLDEVNGRLLSESRHYTGFVMLGLGIALDLNLEVRLAGAVGALLTGIGLLLNVQFGGFEGTIGLAVILVGNGANRVFHFTYLGYLVPRKVTQVAGAYSMVWVVMNVAAFSGVMLIGWYARDYAETGLWALAGLGIFHAVLLAILSWSGILPQISKIEGTPRNSSSNYFRGLLLMLVACGLAVATFAFLGSHGKYWSLLGEQSGVGRAIVLVLALIGAFVFIALSNQKSVKGRIAIMILAVMTLFLAQTTVNLVLGLLDLYNGAIRFGIAMQVEAILAIIACAIFGAILWFSNNRFGIGYGASANRILIGLALPISASYIGQFFPPVGMPLFFLMIPFLAIGESLWMPSLFGLGWSIGPGHRKGSVIGILLAMESLSSFASGLFPSSIDIGGKPTLSPALGLWIFAPLTILFALLLWQRLRNYSGDTTLPGTNPFD